MPHPQGGLLRRSTRVIDGQRHAESTGIPRSTGISNPVPIQSVSPMPTLRVGHFAWTGDVLVRRRSMQEGCETLFNLPCGWSTLVMRILNTHQGLVHEIPDCIQEDAPMNFGIYPSR